MKGYLFPAGWRFTSDRSISTTDNTSTLFSDKIADYPEKEKPYATLALNQELIGVYGKYGSAEITQLGFIVKEEVLE